jgi:hypothetical protein
MDKFIKMLLRYTLFLRSKLQHVIHTELDLQELLLRIVHFCVNVCTSTTMRYGPGILNPLKVSRENLISEDTAASAC